MKDWKKELREVVYKWSASGRYGELENFIETLLQQEREKARQEVVEELKEEFSEWGVPDDVRYTKPLFYINEILEKYLSKKGEKK